jgi:hypothetical protein
VWRAAAERNNAITVIFQYLQASSNVAGCGVRMRTIVNYAENITFLSVLFEYRQPYLISFSMASVTISVYGENHIPPLYSLRTLMNQANYIHGRNKNVEAAIVRSLKTKKSQEAYE